MPNHCHSSLIAGFLAGLALTACSGGNQPPKEQPPAQPAQAAEPLGIEASQVLLSIPWTTGMVSHDPTPGQVRATLASVKLSSGSGFQRATLEFMPYSGLPAYRVEWDSTGACRDKRSLGGARKALAVRFWPVVVQKTLERPKPETENGPMKARQLCTDADVVTLPLELAAPAAVRVTEAKNPPRLVIDVRDAPLAVTSDSAVGGPAR